MQSVVRRDEKIRDVSRKSVIAARDGREVFPKGARLPRHGQVIRFCFFQHGLVFTLAQEIIHADQPSDESVGRVYVRKLSRGIPVRKMREKGAVQIGVRLSVRDPSPKRVILTCFADVFGEPELIFLVAQRLIDKKRAVKGQFCNTFFQRECLIGKRFVVVKLRSALQSQRVHHVAGKIDPFYKVVGFAPFQKDPVFKVFQKPVFVFVAAEKVQDAVDFFSARTAFEGCLRFSIFSVDVKKKMQP